MDLLRAAIVLEERAREAHEWRMDSKHTKCRGVLGDCPSKVCDEAVKTAAELRKEAESCTGATTRCTFGRGWCSVHSPAPPSVEVPTLPHLADALEQVPSVAIDPSALERAVGPSDEEDTECGECGRLGAPAATLYICPPPCEFSFCADCQKKPTACSPGKCRSALRGGA